MFENSLATNHGTLQLPRAVKATGGGALEGVGVWGRAGGWVETDVMNSKLEGLHAGRGIQVGHWR